MAIENDWFMKQVKGVADMIGTTLRLQIQNLDLGQYEDEEGRLINGGSLSSASPRRAALRRGHFFC